MSGVYFGRASCRADSRCYRQGPERGVCRSGLTRPRAELLAGREFAHPHSFFAASLATSPAFRAPSTIADLSRGRLRSGRHDHPAAAGGGHTRQRHESSNCQTRLRGGKTGGAWGPRLWGAGRRTHEGDVDGPADRKPDVRRARAEHSGRVAGIKIAEAPLEAGAADKLGLPKLMAKRCILANCRRILANHWPMLGR